MKRLPALLLTTVLFPAVAFAQMPGAQPPDDTAPPPAAEPQQPQQQPPQQPEPTKEEVQAFERQLMGQFEKADNYDIEGQVAQLDLDAGAMVVTRESLPPVLLVAPESVPVKINGKKATLSDLAIGSEVRATFNISQNFPIALSLDAKAPKAPKNEDQGKKK